jgi:hypothetical protein
VAKKPIPDKEPDHPAGHGGQETDPKQGLDGLNAQKEAEEEAPDREQDQEQPVAAKNHRQSKQEGDQGDAK